MDTTDSDESPATTLPAFTPVPRLKDRSNGWKPHIQRAFIEALAETGSVRAACRRVGRSDHGAYNLRRHPEAGEFRKAWDAALDLGVRRIEDGAMDRALYGTEETIHYHGEKVATRRRYNERLVMFLLRNRAPDRFGEHGARGPDAIGRMKLKRLKKEWREEWEEEQAKNRVPPAQVRATIERKVEEVHARARDRERRDWASLSQEARDAFIRYTTLRARDLAREAEIPYYLEQKDDEPPRENWWDVDESWLDTPRGMAGMAMEKPIALPPPEREESEAKASGEEPEGPVLRSIKDEGWD